MVYETTPATWPDIVAAPGDGVLDGELSHVAVGSKGYSTPGQYSRVYRGIYGFAVDLPANYVVESATLYLKGSLKIDFTGNEDADINIYAVAPTSDTSLAVGDYSEFSSVAFSNTITYANFVIDSYNAFPLDPAGIAHIQNGMVFFGTRDPTHDVAVIAPTWGSGNIARLYTYTAEQGDGYEPYLEITYSISEPAYQTLVVLPDTQGYSMSYPEIYNSQTQWIVDNQDTENIIFVTHVGDIVNSSIHLGTPPMTPEENARQWGNARTAMDILASANISYSVLPGNHDIDSGLNYTCYNEYFPYTEFDGQPWYGGHFPATGNENNYAYISIGGDDFLILNISCKPRYSGGYSITRQEVYEWANSVIASHSNMRVIVVTHAYLDAFGNIENDQDSDADDLWNSVIKQNSRIVAVLNGHFHNVALGEYYTSSIGNWGNPIHNLLANYQGYSNYGDGYLRLYRFFPDDNRVDVLTYSPYLDQYETDSDSQFSFTLYFNGIK